MGLLLSRFYHAFGGKRDLRILMLGLDGAGKTTILYKLKMNQIVATIPTIGFNVELIEYKSLRFTVWDIGGQERIRHLWYHYFSSTAAIIFVIDSADVARLNEARKELHGILSHTDLLNAAVLIFANKQDLPQALNMTELSKLLELHQLKHMWYIHPTCGISGNGINEGLEYLHEMLTTKNRRALQ